MSGMTSLSSFATGMLRKCLVLGCMSFLLEHVRRVRWEANIRFRRRPVLRWIK
jgi:hypothetical protein